MQLKHKSVLYLLILSYQLTFRMEKSLLAELQNGQIS